MQLWDCGSDIAHKALYSYVAMMTYVERFRVTIINNKPYREQAIKNLVEKYYIDVLKCCQVLYFVLIY